MCGVPGNPILKESQRYNGTGEHIPGAYVCCREGRGESIGGGSAGLGPEDGRADGRGTPPLAGP